MTSSSPVKSSYQFEDQPLVEFKFYGKQIEDLREGNEPDLLASFTLIFASQALTQKILELSNKIQEFIKELGEKSDPFYFMMNPVKVSSGFNEIKTDFYQLESDLQQKSFELEIWKSLDSSATKQYVGLYQMQKHTFDAIKNASFSGLISFENQLVKMSEKTFRTIGEKMGLSA